MMRQSEFKRKYDPEIGKYTKQHICGEGIMDSVNPFLKNQLLNVNRLRLRPLRRRPKK